MTDTPSGRRHVPFDIGSATSPHAAIAGEMGAGKRFRYHHALTVFADAGCIITHGEDGLVAFGVVAPEGMSENEFRDLTHRAWYW
ncbi:hypothetical protein AB0876_32105 [Mycobacterium sp. NPDC049093]